MITAYLAGIPSLYEGEDIEIQYSIFEDEKLLLRESMIIDYVKPALVGQYALVALLKKLKEYSSQEIVIMVNDTVLYESIRGTLKTKNKELLKKASETQKKLAKYENCTLKDVSANHKELMEWLEALKA